jgi:prepilin-type N-terminal cleavage/methylation domain-containing protein
MISRIGNNKGFTLIEVMIATAVLALGTVLIHEAFLSSLDAFDYYYNYLRLASWADEKIWDAQDELLRLGPQADIEREGEFSDRNKNFRWSLSYVSLEETKSLYGIDLILSWQEGKRKASILRSAYAIYEKE